MTDEDRRHTTEQGEAAMEEFGFEMVELDQVGAPTPGRIADRLFDVINELERAETPQAVLDAVAKLRRLRGALDAWDCGTLHKFHKP